MATVLCWCYHVVYEVRSQLYAGLIRSRRRLLFHMGGKSKSTTTTGTQSHTLVGSESIMLWVHLAPMNPPAIYFRPFPFPSSLVPASLGIELCGRYSVTRRGGGGGTVSRGLSSPKSPNEPHSLPRRKV